MREQAAQNTKILAVCSAVLHYYGVLPEGDLLRIVNDLGWKLEAHVLSQLLDWTAGAHDYVYRIDDQWLRYPVVEDKSWLRKGQAARAELNLRPLTAEMALSLDAKGYTPEEVRRQGWNVSTEPLEMPALCDDELFGDDSFFDDGGPSPFDDGLTAHRWHRSVRAHQRGCPTRAETWR